MRACLIHRASRSAACCALSFGRPHPYPTAGHPASPPEPAARVQPGRCRPGNTLRWKADHRSRRTVPARPPTNRFSSVAQCRHAQVHGHDDGTDAGIGDVDDERSSSAVRVTLQVTDSHNARLPVDLSACPVGGDIRCMPVRKTSMTSHELGVIPSTSCLLGSRPTVPTGEPTCPLVKKARSILTIFISDAVDSPPVVEVVAGVDTHADNHHVAVLTATGTRSGNLVVPATLALRAACGLRPLLRCYPTDRDRGNGFLRRRPGSVPNGFEYRDSRSPSTSSCAAPARQLRSHRCVCRSAAGTCRAEVSPGCRGR